MATSARGASIVGDGAAVPPPHPLLLDWAHISDEEIIKSASSAANVVGVVAGGRGNGCKGNTGRITMPTRT